MEDFFEEIEKGLNARVYQLSLGMALCIPDICAALQSEDGKTNGSKYKAWYDKYMGNKLQMTSSDCYYFRCSFLHQGSTEHERSQFKRIIFAEPSPVMVFHNNVFDDVLNLDLVLFCKDMIESGRQWFNDVKETDTFKRNYEKSYKKYPEGLAPFIVGIPIYS